MAVSSFFFYLYLQNNKTLKRTLSLLSLLFSFQRHQWGDHVVTGVTLGCSASHTSELDSEDIRGHGSDEIIRAYTIINQQKLNYMNDIEQYEHDIKYNKLDQLKDTRRKDTQKEDNDRGYHYFDNPGHYNDDSGKKASWIHERRRRLLEETTTTKPLPSSKSDDKNSKTNVLPSSVQHGSLSVEYIGGDTSKSAFGIGPLSL